MFLTRRTKHAQFELSLQILLVLITCIFEVRGQQPGSNHPSMRDQVRAIERAEMDRLLLFSASTKPESGSSRAQPLKQIREDFRDLQGLNNKMMSEAWAHQTLDYSFISDMVSRIREKATRLKTNLNLPDPANLETVSMDQNVANTNDFRAALMTLDRTIMMFVSNPLFQKPNTIEVDQAVRARQDLESVIQLTANLKKIASRLHKASRIAK
jgi:hypothetical protein